MGQLGRGLDRILPLLPILYPAGIWDGRRGGCRLQILEGDPEISLGFASYFVQSTLILDQNPFVA